MNSAEQRDFEHITPTPAEVEVTQQAIRKVLSVPDLNEQAAEGYHAALEILSGRTFGQAAQLSNRGKAIVVAAGDYLGGACSREALLALAAD
jgi:hypothetical protein